jgi:histidinol-phosphate aminotransferase
MNKQTKIDKLIISRLQNMQPYSPIYPPDIIAEKFGVLESDIVKLDGNENMFGSSPNVAKALGEFKNYNIYPDPLQEKLRESIANYVGVTADSIIAGAGSDEIIDLLIRLFIEPGDKICQPVPTFAMYSTFNELVGGQTISVSMDEHFDISEEEILSAVNNGVKIVFLTSPNNPTGRLIDKNLVKKILTKDVLVIVDEAYYEFSGQTCVDLISEHSNLVILRTFSKWAGLAGMRIGYGVMHPKLVSHLLVIKPPYNISVAAELAVKASLDDLDLLLDRVENIKKERDWMFNKLSEISYIEPIPSYANFILCKVDNNRAELLYKKLLSKGILVRHYENELLKDYLRISIGSREQNLKLLNFLSQ